MLRNNERTCEHVKCRGAISSSEGPFCHYNNMNTKYIRVKLRILQRCNHNCYAYPHAICKTVSKCIYVSFIILWALECIGIRLIFNFTHSFNINLIIKLYFLHLHFGRALLVKHFYQLSCIKLIKSNSKDMYNVVKNPETTKLILTCFHEQQISILEWFLKDHVIMKIDAIYAAAENSA